MKLLLAIAVLAAAGSGWAQGTFEAISDYTQDAVAPINGTAGWTFQPSADLTVTDLGCFANVFSKNLNLTSVEVGLWAPGGTLLTSTFISPGSSTLFDNTLYGAITPVLLSPGQIYEVGIFALPGGNLSLDASLGGSFLIGPGITVRGTALVNTGTFARPIEAQPIDGAIYAGPNLRYQEGGVPEPSSGLLLSLGALLLAAVRARKQRADSSRVTLRTLPQTGAAAVGPGRR
jgi:hypothetical protein